MNLVFLRLQFFIGLTPELNFFVPQVVEQISEFFLQIKYPIFFLLLLETLSFAIFV